MPLSRRGGVWLDTASTTSGDGRFSFAWVDFVTSMPIARTTFLDVRLPFGFVLSREVTLGNVPIGVRHVFPNEGSGWFWRLGAAIALPLFSSDAQNDEGQFVSMTRAFWNAHEVLPDVFPVVISMGLDVVFETGTLRFDVEPVLLPPIGDGEDVQAIIQHAVEIQLGHDFGGGLRLQGVAIPTNEDDLYQLAFEPFLAIERRLGFLRLGLVLPVDEELGPPLANIDGDRRSPAEGYGGWAVTIASGVRLD